MDLSANFGPLLFGFVIGWYALSRVAFWVALCIDVVYVERRPWQLAVAMSTFHSGPWALIFVVLVAYNLHEQPWASWFFWALAGGFALYVLPLLMAWPHLRRAVRDERNAA